MTPSSSAGNNRKHKRRRLVSTLLALSIYSYIGETIRKFTEELFGLACHVPNRWATSSTEEWPICTTDPGTTESTGGALFIDLPANMLGCFLIGLFVAGDVTTKTPVDMPIAFLGRRNFFQTWTSTHVGIRAGLCGSLTTFASWNTQMVTMLCAGSGTVLSSQWVSVLFGYCIGWMTAVESFRFGRDVALMLNRRNNPDLREEADALAHSHYVLVHRDLPDLERRFLYDTGRSNVNDSDDGIKQQERQQDDDNIQHLQTWKDDTHAQRTTLDPFLKELHEIERAVLVDNEEPQEYLMHVAADCGWNVKALQHWKESQHDENNNNEENKAKNDTDSSLPTAEWIVNTTIFVVATTVLLWGAISLKGTLRIYFLSALFAPFGTILRWWLSRFNARMFQDENSKLSWLPVGTFCANMCASVISSCMHAAALKIPSSSKLAQDFVAAVESGFAGSLSTVSTLVVESVSLLQALPQHACGYYYSIGSFMTAGILGVICYAWAV